jgi:hypothetical protein
LFRAVLEAFGFPEIILDSKGSCVKSTFSDKLGEIVIISYIPLIPGWNDNFIVRIYYSHSHSFSEGGRIFRDHHPNTHWNLYLKRRNSKMHSLLGHGKNLSLVRPSSMKFTFRVDGDWEVVQSYIIKDLVDFSYKRVDKRLYQIQVIFSRKSFLHCLGSKVNFRISGPVSLSMQVYMEQRQLLVVLNESVETLVETGSILLVGPKIIRIQPFCHTGILLVPDHIRIWLA